MGSGLTAGAPGALSHVHRYACATSVPQFSFLHTWSMMHACPWHGAKPIMGQFLKDS
jgi:hypothetical protein